MVVVEGVDDAVGELVEYHHLEAGWFRVTSAGLLEVGRIEDPGSAALVPAVVVLDTYLPGTWVRVACSGPQGTVSAACAGPLRVVQR